MSNKKRKTLSLSSNTSEDEDLCPGENSFNLDGANFYGSRKRIRPNDNGASNRLSNVSEISSTSVASSTGSDGETSPARPSFSSNKFNFSFNEEELQPQSDASTMSNAQKIMMNMGYKAGKGLGKFQQGIVDPIAASQQRGRRGFGFTIPGLEPMENLTWDKSKEYISVDEEVLWLPPSNRNPLSMQLLSEWMKEGPKKTNINGELEFCHPRVLQEVLQAKTVFDKLPEKELYKARTRSNPFETIGKLFFQNRAALKMANLDSMFDFMFTKPVDENGHSMIGNDELLYFADVCAAPGGFTEYVLWKRKELGKGFCDAKGFGFTLRSNDFKLHDFFAAPSEFFEPHYGVSGLEGDGDIYVPENITNFCKFVRKSTKGKGVHFMMADGGFSVEGQENIQEILSKQIYLCQFLVALGIVRDGGHFVCKLFDIFTPFSVGLIYIMYRCFKKVSLHKPNSSRPANSERYIICKWKLENTKDSFDYLYEVNLRLRGFTSADNVDVTDLIDLDILKGEAHFYDYICEVNNTFGERQVIALQKIQAFCRDTSLYEEQQEAIRSESLQLWHLPNKSRKAPFRMDAKATAKQLLNTEKTDQMKTCPENLTLINMESKVHSVYDYRFVILASPKEGDQSRGFFLGLGGCNVFVWNGRKNMIWTRCTVTSFELPSDTLVYGEIVTEFRGELKAQRKVNVFHMIDGIFLNNFDVSTFHVVERHRYLRKFATALNKEGRNDLAPIRFKNLYKLEELRTIFQPPTLCKKIMKSGPVPKRVFCESQQTIDELARYTIPTGIMLLKDAKDPWMMAFSRSQNRKYWFNTVNRKSTFECLQEVISPTGLSYSKGSFWWWEDGVQVLEDDKAEPSCLHLEILLQHFDSLMNS